LPQDKAGTTGKEDLMPISDLLPWNRDKERYAIQRSDELDPLDFQRQMNRMFDTFFDEPFRPGMLRPLSETSGNFAPRLDISETDTEIRINADLPGMDENDIHLTLENNELTISGEKKTEKEEKGRTFHRLERRYGSFTRTIDLPIEVNIDQIDASFKKGVLVVTIPKPKETVSQRKRIPIKAG